MAVWSCVPRGGLTDPPLAASLMHPREESEATPGSLQQTAQQLGLGQCIGGWQRIDSSRGLAEFDRQLVIASLRRRVFTWQERSQMKRRLGGRLSLVSGLETPLKSATT